MGIVTDKELLTFCNLTNLKMEYAKLKYFDTDKKKEINHTIYSLLEKEYIGINERTSLNTAMKTENIRKEYGSFYSFDKDNIPLYFYDSKKDLRIKAPVLLEYFDRYQVSKNKNIHEGKFLKEWSIIKAYDQYNLGVELLNKIKANSKNSFDIPSRYEVELKKSFQFAVEYLIEIIDNGSSYLSSFGKGLKTITPTSVTKFFKIDFGTYSGIIDEISGIDGTTPLTKGLKFIAEKLKKDNIPHEYGKIKINLSDSGVRFLILKNKEKYIISIGNSSKLSKQEIKECLPQSFFTTYLAIKMFLEENQNIKENVIITGNNDAGYLVQLLGSALELKYTVFSQRYEKNLKPFKSTDLKTLDNQIDCLTTTEIIYSSLNQIGIGVATGIISLFKGILVGSTFPLTSFLIAGGIITTKITQEINRFLNNKMLIENLELIGILKDNTIMDLKEQYNLNFLPSNINKEINTDIYLQILYYKYLNFLIYKIDLSKKEIILIKNGQETKKIILRENDYVIQSFNMSFAPNYGEYTFKEDELWKKENWTDEINPENFIGKKLLELLKIFKSMSKEYKTIEVETWRNLGTGENITYYLESKENPSEYLYWLFTDRSSGNITAELRKEYIKSVIKSVVDKDEVKKYDDWNLRTEENKNGKYRPYQIAKEYDKEILTEINRFKHDQNKFPYLYKVNSKVTEDNINKYYVKTDDLNGRDTIHLGLVDENGKYLEDEIGFIYNPFDRIQGHEYNIQVKTATKKDLEEISEPTASPITMGTVLKCNCGSAPTPLIVTSQCMFSMKGNFTATEKDCAPNVNIMPFGNCKNLPLNPPCPLAITGKWDAVSKVFTINDGAVLLDSSVMKCTLGGEIKPTSGVGYWKSK